VWRQAGKTAVRLDTGSHDRNQVSGRVPACHLVKKAKSRRFVWDCIIGGGDRTRTPSAASRAGEGTRTLDIQLGSNPLLFELRVAAATCRSTRFWLPTSPSPETGTGLATALREVGLRWVPPAGRCVGIRRPYNGRAPRPDLTQRKRLGSSIATLLTAPVFAGGGPAKRGDPRIRPLGRVRAGQPPMRPNVRSVRAQWHNGV
jgi:hypothetical protein